MSDPGASSPLAAVRALSRAAETDTIAALASAPGRGRRAVIRCSGPRALELARRLFATDEAGERLAGRGFVRIAGALRLPDWPPLDASLWLFRAPRSYTGEDAWELHVPGSPPLVQAALRTLERSGARTAQPGEFTRRAFLSGRLDLAQAEAVLALTRAEAEGEVRSAARALLGGLRDAIDHVKERTLHALAHVEAAIDFPDEDLPGLDPAEKLALAAEAAASDLERLARRSVTRATPRSEPTVVLAGLANAGKSTLLNALARADAAIVSPVAGTTRDPVALTAELLPGRTVRLVDTAGEMAAQHDIERLALERAREHVETADLLVYLVDLAADDPASARARLAQLGTATATLVVGTKLDLVGSDRLRRLASAVDVAISARTGEGVDALRLRLASTLEAEAGIAPELVQTERQARLVLSARASLERAAALFRSAEPARFELAAVDLRGALEALGELTGALVTDDLLDRIFGEFCIGK